MVYDESAFAALVGKVLEELEGGTWVLDEVEHGRFYLQCPALDSSHIVLSLSKGRVVVYGFTSAAPDAWGVEWPEITVAAQRGPEVVAREIERRLLPRYREALAEALEAQRQHDEHRRTVHAQAAELAALLGVSFEPATTDQPRLSRFQHLSDGDHARLQLRVGCSTHRLELSLPHAQAVAVVELLAGLWRAG